MTRVFDSSEIEKHLSSLTLSLILVSFGLDFVRFQIYIFLGTSGFACEARLRDLVERGGGVGRRGERQTRPAPLIIESSVVFVQWR